MGAIRTLVRMLATCSERQDALEGPDSLTGDVCSPEWSTASRVWTRQQEALSSAIVAEPPEDLREVLAVLAELAARQCELLNTAATPEQLREIHELSAAATVNCAVAMMRLLPAEESPGEPEYAGWGWLPNRAKYWLAGEGVR
jgi:hypothetical protein